MEALRISTFNCKGFRSSRIERESLCNTLDILVLQETWLFKNESNILNEVHKDFYGVGLSAMDTEKCIITGRPYGGLAILYRKHFHVTSKLYDDTRIMGVELIANNNSLLFSYIMFTCHIRAMKTETIFIIICL